MRLNRTSELKVMTIWISQELPLPNFERLDMWFAWIGHPFEKLWPFEFLKSFHLLNFVRLDILCAWIEPPSEKLWPFEFLESFRCSISSVSIYYVPESDLRVESNNHLSLSRASVVQFQASRYIMRLNESSDCKVMTAWISLELLLVNSKRLDILCAWIGPPCGK